MASLRETNYAHVNYAKALNKLFKDKPLPSSEIDALSAEPALVNRAIYLHLLREGLFSVAKTFHEEANTSFDVPVVREPTLVEGEVRDTPGLTITDRQDEDGDDMQKQFADMYYILHKLKDNRDLRPAIDWGRVHSQALEARGSNLEFELCRLQFVSLFQEYMNAAEDFDEQALQLRAISYARQELQVFYRRYPHEVQQLMGAVAYWSNLEQSPYQHIFHNTSAWEEVANSFTREFCSLLELSADSPLYVAATAGAIALPKLLKLQKVKEQKRTEWTTENELPVEIPLPPSYLFHSIFVCPVLKAQTTDENPPMVMPCGHVIASESLNRLSKGSKFKCPYCPNESHPREARKIFL